MNIRDQLWYARLHRVRDFVLANLALLGIPVDSPELRAIDQAIALIDHFATARSIGMVAEEDTRNRIRELRHDIHMGGLRCLGGTGLPMPASEEVEQNTDKLHDELQELRRITQRRRRGARMITTEGKRARAALVVLDTQVTGALADRPVLAARWRWVTQLHRAQFLASRQRRRATA